MNHIRFFYTSIVDIIHLEYSLHDFEYCVFKYSLFRDVYANMKVDLIVPALLLFCYLFAELRKAIKEKPCGKIFFKQ